MPCDACDLPAGVRLLIERRTDSRAHVLTEAATCVLQNRNAAYGEPEDNFRRIADLWSAWLWGRGLLPRGTFLEPHDVAILMGLVKDARAIESPQVIDHYIDKAGYAACAYRAALFARR